MATEKQIEANRLNALKSTGPTTPEGKAVSKLNGVRHGMRAATTVLPFEVGEKFLALCENLERQWNPQGPTEEFYLEQMAVSQWKLHRAEAHEQNIESQNHGDVNKIIPLLDKLTQCVVRLERSYTRAQRELERLQQARRQAEVEQPDSLPVPPAPFIVRAPKQIGAE